MDTSQLIEQVLNSDDLPTLPTVASKLITLTSREDTTLSDIAELVSQDVSLSSKILKVSNSAFYSFPQQISTIKQAVSILGTNAVRSLVLSFSFLTMRDGNRISHFNFELFWERSLASAVAAKLILEKVKGADTEEIFIAGLLQNLGELIFARTFPKKYDEVLLNIEEKQHDLIFAEETVFGTTHPYIGYYVAKHWGFPEVLLAPILYHQTPDKYEGEDKTIRQIIYAVYLSDLLVNIIYSDKPQVYHRQFRKEARKTLGLQTNDIEDVLAQVHLQIEQAALYFGLKIKGNKPVQEILQEANIRLSLLNLNYDQMNKELIKSKMELEKLTRELKEKNKFLDNLANNDGLTGVFNHRYFQTSLENEVDRSIRNNSPVALIYADIDHFKNFNDTYGHQAGDFVLKEFCKVLTANIRKYDTLARYGGEEFAIILPETTAEEAMAVAEKLRVSVESHVFEEKFEKYQVTSSFGVAAVTPATEDDFTKDTLILMADKALYEAKRKGRNRVELYTEKKKWYSFK